MSEVAKLGEWERLYSLSELLPPPDQALCLYSIIRFLIHVSAEVKVLYRFPDFVKSRWTDPRAVFQDILEFALNII